MLKNLHGQHVILKKINIEDIETIHQALTYSYADIAPWVSWLNPNHQFEDTHKIVTQQINNWATNVEYTFTINNEKNGLLGVINLHVFDRLNGVANIGYWMNSQFTNSGYCSEAVKILVEQGYLQLNLIRIELLAGVNNIASQKVAINCGATFEGVLKKRIRPSGISADAYLYAFIRD